MKIASEGKLTLETGEIEELQAAAKDDTLYRYKMLENSTKTVVLLEEGSKDHREMRSLLYKIGAALTAIMASMGIVGVVV